MSASTVTENSPAIAAIESLYVKALGKVDVVAFAVILGLISVRDGVPCLVWIPSAKAIPLEDTVTVPVKVGLEVGARDVSVGWT